MSPLPFLLDDLHHLGHSEPRDTRTGFDGVKVGLGARDPGPQQGVSADPHDFEHGLSLFDVEGGDVGVDEFEAGEVFREVVGREVLQYEFTILFHLINITTIQTTHQINHQLIPFALCPPSLSHLLSHVYSIYIFLNFLLTNVYLFGLFFYECYECNNIIRMNPDTYIYQLRRPRPDNRTYNSSSIGQTCFSIYSGGPLDSHTNHSNKNNHSNNQQLKQHLTRTRGSSQLSQIGSSSLSQMQDSDIYKHQRNKYDIITMQPIPHQEQTIHKYPKITLEDKDRYYYRQRGIPIETPAPLRHSQKEPITTQRQAGRHTYALDQQKIALQLWESYQGRPTPTHKFSPKMLNHADEFRSLF